MASPDHERNPANRDDLLHIVPTSLKRTARAGSADEEFLKDQCGR